MIKFVYKADNAFGDQRVGTIVAPSDADARRILREKGLVSTFIEDIHIYKKKRKERKRRHQLIMRTGAILILVALGASGWMVNVAGRETAVSVAGLKESGVLRGNAGTIIADSEETELFAHQIVEAWASFAPGLITGIEVRKNLMTLYVNGTAKGLEESDLEVLATGSLRALQREFDASGATMLIIEDELTIMELRYNPFTQSMKIRDYR